jgi:hypothetical protein
MCSRITREILTNKGGAESLLKKLMGKGNSRGYLLKTHPPTLEEEHMHC